ncbi:uncharacterized protein LOC142357801 isoform X2 [Convolutriloba macropyga]|uniref:uncharacterized protein LOC142357801 isoform X2 n=1 Tax=Convolutriloba macropyga TaxID=536237 RepID=UPI003F51C1BC
MKKRNRRAVIFLIILNTFLILFAIAILIVLLVGDFYWKVDLYYDLLDAKGLEGVYLVYYLTASLAIVVGILALVTVCVKRKTLGRVYAGFAIVICCVLLCLMIAWIIVLSIFISDLSKKLRNRLHDYKGEFGHDDVSVVFNYMFVRFSTCGATSGDNFKDENITWTKITNFENYTYPLTCCRDIKEFIDANKILDHTFTVEDLQISDHKELYDHCYEHVNEKGTLNLLNSGCGCGL